MDLGIVAKRYAKTLLKYAVERKSYAVVYQQMKQLSDDFFRNPELMRAMQDPLIGGEAKLRLLHAAVYTEEGLTDDTIDRFFQLVVENHRAELLPFIAQSYCGLYLCHEHKAVGRLTTSVPISDKVEQQFRKLIKIKTDKDIIFEKQVDPTIKGGFILEVDNYLLDASLKTQISHLQRKLG